MNKAVALGLLLASTQMAGCISGMENPFTDYLVIKPLPTELVTKDQLSTYQVMVKLPSRESTAPIYFNGQNVSSCFDFDTIPATAPLSCMSEYIRQDGNTISVNPSRLLKGTTRSFIMDTLGPYVNIKDVCYSGGSASAACVLRETGNVEVKVEYSDPSSVATASLNDYSASEDNGKSKTFVIPIADHYVFQSTDNLGYTSMHTYARDGLGIDELFNVRIDETMLNELRPLINKGATGIEMGIADGSGEPVLEGIHINMGIQMAADVLYVQMGKFDMKVLSIDDDANANLHTKLMIDPIGVEGVDWIKGNNIVENTNNVGVEVLLHINDYTKCSGWTCGYQGWPGPFTEAIPCPIPKWNRCNIGLIGIDMRMYIERIQVEGDVAGKDGGEMVTNGKFSLDLINHDTDVMKMMDVKANLRVNESSGSSDQNIIEKIIESPAIRGMMKGMIVKIVNDNMDALDISKTFEFDTGAEMEVAALIEKLATDAGAGGDNIGDLHIGMSGAFSTIKSDTTIKPALGSYYVDDASGLPVAVDEGSNLAVTVNSNIINQALLAMYNTGATHLTLLNGKMHTGYQATDDMGSNGDFRIELNPSSPGEFKLEGISTDQAFIAFRGAEGILGRKIDGRGCRWRRCRPCEESAR